MKRMKSLLIVFIIFLVACGRAKEKQPKVNFDFDKMSKTYQANTKTYVNDSEKLFSESENKKLEELLENIRKTKGKTVFILSVPSAMKSNENWKVGRALGDEKIILIISKSLKEVNIRIEKPISSSLENVIEKQFSEFEKGHFYNGTKEIIGKLTE